MYHWKKFPCLRPALLAVLLLGGCGGEPAAPDTLIRPAKVERVGIRTTSLQTEITVVVNGQLPDGCTRISGVEHKRDGSVFRVTVTTTRPIDIMCTQALVPFRRSIPLAVAGLPAGIYTVDVNGVRESFILH